jgi:hypothetical protein
MLLLVACAADEASLEVTDVTLTPSAHIVTVATLTWTTSAPTRGRVRFGTAERELTSPLEEVATTSHRAVLVGVPAESKVAWTIEDEGGQSLESGTWTTGILPNTLPSVTSDRGTMDRFAVTTLLGASNAVIILSPEGRVVWYHPNESGLDAFRARLRRDGTGIVYVVGDVSGDPSPDSRVVSVSWDGSTTTELAAPYLAQDFIERDDEHIVALAADVRDEVKGNSLVDIAPDGSSESVWDTWDCFDPASRPGNDPTLGWTWTNALDHDEATDEYIVSIRNFSAIVRVDVDARACGTTLGGESSSYTIDGARFLHAHQFDWVDQRVLVFDNDGAGGNRSRALEYALDDDAGVATEVWSYMPDPSVFSFVLGDVARYDDSTLVTFSVAGQIDRVDDSGALMFRATTPVGHVLGYTTLHTELAAR